jgi:UDP-N-acetylglucosamine--N-acetylmuramyl-(pentapeptide) pyrophosphoryl-undecaprenol N-acetylglucosamine transferase
MKDSIVLTGGGTAGHVMPNIALLPKLQQDFDVHYIGTYQGMEHWLVNPYIKQGNYHEIKAGKLRRYLSFQNIKDPFKVLYGFYQSFKILKKLRPQLIFSKGGFVSVPVVYAASLLKIPIILHECDLSPGLANKLTMPKCTKILVSFEQTLAHTDSKKSIFTGTPVRRELLCGDKQKGKALCDIKNDKPTLLVMCGSSGAVAINTVLDNILEKLCKNFNVVHIRGRLNIREELNLIDGYKQFGFIGEDLKDIYAAADFMLSRSGANAIFEILELDMPTLLIPLPKSSSRGDQILNAEHFEEKGWSKVLVQEELNEDTLYSDLLELFAEKSKLINAMRVNDEDNATEKVLKEIYNVLEG